MSEVHIEDHPTPIHTPGQLITVIVLAFLVPILTIVLVVQMVTGGLRVDGNSPAMSEDAIAKRLKPVGEVVLADKSAGADAPAPGPAAAQAAAGSTSAAKPDGAQIYQTVCSMCHATGLVGSPKYGDKTAWKPRIAQGLPTLREHAVKGIRTMPPKGGSATLTDTEVGAAVDYMVNHSK